MSYSLALLWFMDTQICLVWFASVCHFSTLTRGCQTLTTCLPANRNQICFVWFAFVCHFFKLTRWCQTLSTSIPVQINTNPPSPWLPYPFVIFCRTTLLRKPVPRPASPYIAQSCASFTDPFYIHPHWYPVFTRPTGVLYFQIPIFLTKSYFSPSEWANTFGSIGDIISIVF